MTDRWVVWLGGLVASAVLFATGQRWWSVAVLFCCGLISSWFGGPQLDPQRVFDDEQRAEILDRAGGRCQWLGCGVALHEESSCPAGGCGRDYNADHVFPWAKGGRTVVENGQALCRTHNLAKSDRVGVVTRLRAWRTAGTVPAARARPTASS